ncbi:hypothetical protein SAMD00019534_098910 [Acytostelium subglobosum LB1]|uniref:hypothetical protein n=1 Tax=Acytostelium subglobosum LB1 TaxID=1410327 RepID=UPI000644F917|nr:hypothetical protein SAMD00019534_098910 [Acytostelium subglobosum LB1]GAM26716.1 hypothetical protein SAMD00019534_098910 [Acytostelium subglobosum LB1]|eukprot:XP_012750377.1 hypothetical protein SAMD00019534_098910 [Acytostelium subglobosum LB1]
MARQTRILSLLVFSLALIGGGMGVLNFLTDSWILIILSNAKAAPAPVAGHSSVLNPVNNTLVVFGGNNAKNYTNSLKTYDVVNDAWISINDTTPKPSNQFMPSPRSGHVAITTPTNMMYVFGGRNDTTIFQDIYKYDMVDDIWIQLNVSGTPPAPRYGHSGIMYPITNEFLFFGGMGTTGVLSDIVKFEFESNTWSTLQPGNNNIVGLGVYGHSAVLNMANQMVVFGGIVDTNNKTTDQLQFFDVVHGNWVNHTLNTTSGHPAARSGHAAVITPLNQMLVFGGNFGNGATQQTWKYDFTYNTWLTVSPTGYGPDHGLYGQTCTSTLFNTMMVFGGQSSGSDFYNDIFKYNIITSVLRSQSDGVVLVVLLTIVCSMIIGLCFALDLMAEKNEIERLERLEQEAATNELKKVTIAKEKKKSKEERQPLFETF